MRSFSSNRKLAALRGIEIDEGWVSATTLDLSAAGAGSTARANPAVRPGRIPIQTPCGRDARPDRRDHPGSPLAFLGVDAGRQGG